VKGKTAKSCEAEARVMLIRICPQKCFIENNNHYLGYGLVRTLKGKVVHIKGAPRLYKWRTISGSRDDEVIPGTRGTKSGALVNELLKHPDITEWGNFLTGNFLLAVVDAQSFKCHIITDLGNSFHLFYGFSRTGSEIVFSTHIDRLAFELGLSDNIDHVSIVDYLTQQSISYPYTFYEGLKEIQYASCLSCSFREREPSISVHQYWRPTCLPHELSDNIRDLSMELRVGIRKAFEEIVADKDNVAAFISGGTDSRVIAGLLAELGIDGLAITVADTFNLETKIAAEVAAANGLRHQVLLRDVEYYPRLIDDSLALEGPHFAFTGNVFLGFREQILSRGFDALIGGYMSDTLLKLHEANQVGRYLFGRHLGGLWKLDRTELKYLRGGSEYLKRFSHIFKKELLDRVRERREKLLESWNDLRTDGSAWEWSYMWPFTRNKMNSHLTTNIFNYQAFEIFTDRSVIEVARIASQKIKINGRLFNKATWPWVKRARHIPISNNMVPPRPGWRGEFLVALSHFLPRHWTLRNTYPTLITDNVVATDRSWPDLYKLWEHSRILKELRHTYGTSGMGTEIMTIRDECAFDPEPYARVPRAIRFHIMYSLLFLDQWQKKIRTASSHSVPSR